MGMNHESGQRACNHLTDVGHDDTHQDAADVAPWLDPIAIEVSRYFGHRAYRDSSDDVERCDAIPDDDDGEDTLIAMLGSIEHRAVELTVLDLAWDASRHEHTSEPS